MLKLCEFDERDLKVGLQSGNIMQARHSNIPSAPCAAFLESIASTLLRNQCSHCDAFTASSKGRTSSRQLMEKLKQGHPEQSAIPAVVIRGRLTNLI